MTKKLEELFQLPDTEENAQTISIIADNREIIEAASNAADKIDRALPGITDLDVEADNELDELATLAKDKFQDLMDLGMNVEPRFSGVIFQTASQLLGHAVTAKQAKLDKKLRMVDLQLKKMRLDQQAEAAANKASGESPIDGDGIVLKREDLLKQILEQNKTNSDK
jgi:hypothetical protein